MEQRAIWVVGNVAHADQQVELRCAALAAAIKPNGAEGLGDLAFDGAPFPATLLTVETPVGPLAPAVESYVRDADHVSTHPATDGFPFRTQLYWSAKALAGGAVAATLSVSLQTDLLDTRPQLSLVTRLPGAEVSSLSDDACRFDTQAGVTVVVTSHPSDAAECTATPGDGECRLHASPPFLEKGVIRRLRFAAIVLPGTASEAAVTGALADLANDPIPLTT